MNSNDCAMILCGTIGAPWVQWATDVVDAAREKGVLCTDMGILYDAGTAPPEQEEREVHDVSQAQLESFVHRAADKPCVSSPQGDGDLCFEHVVIRAVAGEGIGGWSPGLSAGRSGAPSCGRRWRRRDCHFAATRSCAAPTFAATAADRGGISAGRCVRVVAPH